MSLLFFYEFNVKAAGVVPFIPINHFSICEWWPLMGITKYLSYPIFFKSVLIPIRYILKFITHQYMNLSFLLRAFFIFLFITHNLIILKIFTIVPIFFLPLFQIHETTIHEKIYPCAYLFFLKIEFLYFLQKNLPRLIYSF